MARFGIAAAVLALAGGLVAATPAAAQTMTAAAGGGGGGAQSGGNGGGGQLGVRVVRGRVQTPRGLLDLPGGFTSDRRGRTFPRGLLDLPGGFATEERGRRRHDDDDAGWYFGGGYGGGYGVQEPHGYRDRGYFDQQRADRERSRGAGGDFDYDRSYPYDHYRGEADGDDGRDLAMAEPVTRCRMQWTQDRRTRGQVEVRICSR